MKRIENVLCNYSWLFKLGIVVLWIFWAAQLAVPTKEIFKEMTSKRDIKWEQRFNNEMVLFVKSLEEKARTADYGPKKYFEDLKAIEERECEINKSGSYKLFYSPMKSLILQHIMEENRKGSYEDIETASASYREWIKGGGAAGEEFHKEVKANGWQKNLEYVFSWLAVLYRRALILVFLLYLVRMSRRKGILETILADKKRFLLAVCAWPAYISRYPFNIVREIRVEAELRRLGNLFRRLSSEERELAQEIAGSKKYKEWIKGFRTQYGGVFQHSLLIVLVPTIFFYFLVPATSQSHAKMRDGPAYESVQVKKADLKKAVDNFDDNLDDFAILESFFSLDPPAIKRIKVFVKKLVLRVVLKEIEHIPIGYFIFGQAV